MRPRIPQEPAPRLLTVGEIARRLVVPIHRVTYILSTRKIRPVAVAGTARLFDEAAMLRVRRELRAMDSWRAAARLPDGPRSES